MRRVYTAVDQRGWCHTPVVPLSVLSPRKGWRALNAAAAAAVVTCIGGKASLTCAQTAIEISVQLCCESFSSVLIRVLQVA